jgi:hypothetical protein
MDQESSQDEKQKLIKEVEKLRQELEHEIVLESWDDCNEIVGALEAFGIQSVICKTKVPSTQIDKDFDILPAVAVPSTFFDDYKKLLTKLI